MSERCSIEPQCVDMQVIDLFEVCTHRRQRMQQRAENPKQFVYSTNEDPDYEKGVAGGQCSCTEIQSKTAYAYIGKMT